MHEILLQYETPLHGSFCSGLHSRISNLTVGLLSGHWRVFVLVSFF